MLRRVASVLLVVALTWGLVLFVPAVASACSCGLRTLEEQVTGAAVAFIGREVDRFDNPAPDRDEVYVPPVLVVFEVDEWLSDGEPPLEITVGTGQGSSDCGVGNMQGRGQFGIYAFGEPPNLSISSCGGVADAEELRAVLKGLPAPTASSPPGFAVAQSLGDSRMALLDDLGNVVAYGKGEGRVDVLAACPGGSAVVEAISPALSHAVNGAQSLEVRSTDSLEIISTREVFLDGERMVRAGNSVWWIRDLECHDPDGEAISYLLPRTKWDGLAGSELHAPGAQFHWREGDDLRVIEVADARAVAVAPDLGMLVAVAGQDGETLASYDLDSGDQLWSFRLPRGDVAWDIAYNFELQLFGLLANDGPLAPENRYFAAVDRVLLIDPAGTVVATHEYGERRVAVGIDSVPGGFFASTAWENESGIHLLTLGGDGAWLSEEVLPAQSFVGVAASGDWTSVVASFGSAATGADGVGTLTGVSDVRWVTAIRDGVASLPDAEPVPKPPASPPTDGETVTTTQAVDSPVSPPSISSAAPLAQPAPAGADSRLSPWWWLAAFAVVAAFGWLALRRRRTWVDGWSGTGTNKDTGPD